MSTDFLEDVRDPVVDRLAEYLNIPVILSDQEAPRPAYPFVHYSVIAPYIPNGEYGAYSIEDGEDEESLISTRSEQPHATFSFTVCSENRHEGKRYISGEDEAMRYAERAQGFFLHAGRAALSSIGIVVVEVMNSASRSLLDVDEVSRRWGFDLRVRYTKIDEREDPRMDSYNIRKG